MSILEKLGLIFLWLIGTGVLTYAGIWLTAYLDDIYNPHSGMEGLARLVVVGYGVPLVSLLIGLALLIFN